MPTPPPGLVKIELGGELDGPIDSFASRLWSQLRTEACGLLDDVLTGKDPITELLYTDRYVCSPLVVNLLIGVIHELGQYGETGFTIRIQGRQYQKNGNRSPWQCWHDWHTSQQRDDAIRQALEYCGFEGEVLSFPVLPHYRQLQLQLRSGKKLAIQFDQGLSYWETERNRKPYLLRFNFAAHQLGEEIMERIQCRLIAASNERTQIFISNSH